MQAQAPAEQHGGIERTNVILPLDRTRIKEAVELMNRHAVVDGPALPIRQIVEPHQFSLERVAHGNHAVGAIGAVSFVIADAFRRPEPKRIPGTPVFGGMHREHGAMIAASLLDPHHRVGRKPVVSVHHVKMADVVLGLKEVPDERTAHFLDFLLENASQTEGTVMIPDAVDLLRAGLLRRVADRKKDRGFGQRMDGHVQQAGEVRDRCRCPGQTELS